MVLFVVALILLLDQLAKLIVTHNVILHQSVPVVKDFFHITLVHNNGAAFGILKGNVPFFILTTLSAVILIYTELHNHRKHGFSLYTCALSLILAGAMGNLIDRCFLGYVIDFLDFRVWPVFNIADSSITVGSILLGWSMVCSRKSAG